MGFFTIINHNIPEDMISQAYEETRKFFKLPISEKNEINVRHSQNMRGYFGIGEETPEYDNEGDLKEGFDLSTELADDDPDFLAGSKLYGPNQWPKEMPRFRDIMTSYHHAMETLARQILSIYATGLNKDENFFDKFLTKPLAQLRLLHYPPQEHSACDRAIGCGAHTDYGTIALLTQDSPGLEVLSKAGNWIQVEVIDNALIVNIGDLMARWTNDLFVANTHRVINKSDRDRYSMAFFLDPDYTALIECIDTCIPHGQVSKYKPIVFGKYNEEKLDATFQFRKQSI